MEDEDSPASFSIFAIAYIVSSNHISPLHLHSYTITYTLSQRYRLPKHNSLPQVAET